MPLVPRNILKEYFMRGDRPTEGQFGALLDSTANLVDDRYLIGLRSYDPSKVYLIGDTMIYNNALYECIAVATGVFDPLKWQVIASLGSVVYSGTWNAFDNDPILADGTGVKGYYYVVNDAGIQDLGSGPIDFQISDWVIYNGTIWQKVDNSQVPVSASDVSFIPNGDITSTNVQSAIIEVRNDTDAKLAGKQNLITLTPNYFPFANGANTLADGALSNEVDGVVLDNGKVFRSIIPGKSQIDFPAGNTVIISTDGGVGAEAILTLDADDVSLARTSYGELSIKSGVDLGGEIKLLNNNDSNGIVINNTLVQLVNNQGAGGLISVGSDGKVELQSDVFRIDATTTNFNALIASTVPYLDNSKNLVSSKVTPTELGFLSLVTSPIQAQLNGKENALGFVPVPDTRTVNGHPLTADVTVTKADLVLNNVTNDQQLSLKIYFDEGTTASSTSATFSNAYLKNFNLADSGDYLLDWYYEIGSTTTGGDAGSRVSFDAGIPFSESSIKGGVANGFVAVRGFIQRTGLTAGAHTFLIEMNRPTSGGTANFRRPRFTLTKI